jgi:hypothetical protein
MTNYIRFEAGDGAQLLVEVDSEETGAPGGPVKAGLGTKVRDAVATAGSTLDAALSHMIQANARSFLDALDGLERRPAEAELSFGVKATGELGNLAVAKVGGEASYSVRVLWRAD